MSKEAHPVGIRDPPSVLRHSHSLSPQTAFTTFITSLSVTSANMTRKVLNSGPGKVACTCASCISTSPMHSEDLQSSTKVPKATDQPREPQFQDSAEGNNSTDSDTSAPGVNQSTFRHKENQGDDELSQQSTKGPRPCVDDMIEAHKRKYRIVEASGYESVTDERGNCFGGPAATQSFYNGMRKKLEAQEMECMKGDDLHGV